MTTTTWLIILLVLSVVANVALTARLTARRRARPALSPATAVTDSPQTLRELETTRLELDQARRAADHATGLVQGRDLELGRVRGLLAQARAQTADAAAAAEESLALRKEREELLARLRELEEDVRRRSRERDDSQAQALARIHELERRLAEAEDRAEGPLGPEPVSPAIPRQLPVGRDTTADSSVDGADLGPVVVRAASARGDRARHDGEHRRDAVLLRFAEEIPAPTLLSAVAAGSPRGRWSQSAADRACRSLATQVGRYGEGLGRALYGPDGDDGALGALLRTALQGVAHSMRLVTRGEGPGGEADDAAIEVALTGLLTRLGDGREREHLAFGIGDGALLRLRDGEWSTVFTPGDSAPHRTLRLPADAARVGWERLTTLPGDVLAVCSPPMAELLLRDDAGPWFAARWAGRQPYLTSFLSEVNVPVRSTGGDRSVVCLWDFGDAREARSATP
ncbi:protein phosphatase 2C domain-containing protein [Streptomyces sp. A0592]|uniref:protein phosphatase 2C domain-containing protein n=1 Tax=Streptomyces sp. A0592 TaxID=2563099 RepID=UPI00109E6250|nr:protein phosphatase 2C domain-containing protein [Streptomyces sp. A0592]THA74355.1 hypothetical protein E6U81_38040 [Streptomyces sp. A0592]